ncbi:phage tail tape measure protein, partial [Klebsiella pneumoniae]
EEMAAMGFSAREIMQALPGVIAAAEATGEDLGIVMETVAEALNNFGYEASEASRVADVLAEAANASAANIETMHYVMKYAAPTAKQLGMEIEDLAAAAMILADRGLEASQIGRYLRMGLSRLASPTKQAKALMRELGIEVFDAHGKLKPFPEVIRELKTAFDKLTPAQA